MKYLVIGDIHHKISQFQLGCAFLRWLETTAKNFYGQYDEIIYLGDFFDGHSVIRSEILGEFKKHIDIMTKYAPVNYICGNHDYYKPKDSTYHALQSMHSTPNFTVIDSVYNNHEATFIPYIPNPNDFPKKTQDIVFCHQAFKGVDYGYIKPEGEINPENISAKIIIDGHIHNRQNFSKVICPGSAYSQSASDANQHKSIMIFDSNSYKITTIDVPMPIWIKLEYIIRNESIASIILSDIDNLISVGPKDHILLYIEGCKAEIIKFSNSHDFIEIKKKIDVSIKPTYTDTVKKKIAIKSLDLLDIMNQYIDKIYSGTIDKSILKSKIISILK